jgi:hypothetical protein
MVLKQNKTVEENFESMLKTSLLLCTVFAISMSGCAAPKPAPAEDSSAPGVHLALKAAMERADRHREKSLAAQVPSDLSQNRMTVIWEGEGSEILKRIASSQGMKFKVTGPQPRLQLPVFIHLKNVTLMEALDGICDQFGGRADVILEDKSIELRMRLY